VQLQQNGGLTAVHPAKRGVKRERGKVVGVGEKKPSTIQTLYGIGTSNVIKRSNVSNVIKRSKVMRTRNGAAATEWWVDRSTPSKKRGKKRERKS